MSNTEIINPNNYLRMINKVILVRKCLGEEYLALKEGNRIA